MFTLREVVHEADKGIWDYYIYVLFKSNGVPFYVGEGKQQSNKRYRVAYHEAEAKYGHKWKNQRRNHLKLNTIRKIWREAGQVGYCIDSWHNTLHSANERERELIASIGRLIDGTGPLTNISEGGEGRNQSPETIQKISDGLKKYYAEHPEALERISEESKKRFASDEARQRIRESNIQHRTADYLTRWRKEHPEELAKHQAEHSDRMRKWYAEHSKEAESLASGRNEILKSDEHRSKMSERTKAYIERNPEDDKARRKKAKVTFDNKRMVYDRCLEIIQKRLLEDGVVSYIGKVTPRLLYKWKKRGLVTGLPDGHEPIEVWQKYLSTLENKLFI